MQLRIFELGIVLAESVQNPNLRAAFASFSLVPQVTPRKAFGSCCQTYGVGIGGGAVGCAVGMLVGTLVGGIGRFCTGFFVWASIGSESSDARAVARIVFIPLTSVSVGVPMRYSKPKRKEGLMPRRHRSSLVWSGEQAHQAFALLVDEGKLAVGEISKAFHRCDRLIRTLKAKLAALETGVGSLGKRLRGDRASRKARKARTSSRKVARKKRKISAATRAMFRLQGKYLSVLRPLSKKQRTKIKTIREKAGVRKAIAAAKRMS